MPRVARSTGSTTMGTRLSASRLSERATAAAISGFASMPIFTPRISKSSMSRAI